MHSSLRFRADTTRREERPSMKKLFDDIGKNIRALKLIQKYEPSLVATALLSGFFSALQPLVMVFISAKLVDELAGARDKQRLIMLAVIALAAGLLLELVKVIFQRKQNVIKARIYDIIEDIYADKMMSLDFAELDRQYVIDLYWKIWQVTNCSSWGMSKVFYVFEALCNDAFKLIGSIVLSVGLFTHSVPQGSELFFLNNPLFIVLLLMVVFGISAISSVCTGKAEGYWSAQTERGTFSNRIFSFYGFNVFDTKRAADFRLYEQGQIRKHYYRSNNGYGVRSWIAKQARGPMGLLYAAAEGIAVSLTGLAYLFVCLKAWGGAFGIGSVTQYVGAITSLFFGASGLMGQIAGIRTNSSYLDDCFELIDMPNKMYRGSLTTEKRSDRKYDVEFKNVSFKYPGSDQWALRNVNLKFRIGERLAVVGMNGSGKTTFIKLLCRLYDPTEGEILLNGINIKKYRYEDYINVFSVVFQDFQLMALPLGENVAGSRDYDKDKVLQCLTDAGFELSDEKMKNGLSTYIYKELDKEGVEVSGGEAQKIAIARALYKNAPFIILDEPTAALDPIAEAEIYSKFNDIAGDKTAVYISHRLSSCKFCDEIAVFHEGSVIQKGTHEVLVADKSGKYYELWNAQAQYYADDAGAIA
jgi:ATP-binding cassette subfamily B protein